jgi:glycosyltransferase involved in cell wall biosynthesis
MGVTAVNIVLCELLKGLSRLGHQIVLQILFNPFRSATSLSAAEEGELFHLRKDGMEVLPPIYKEEYLPPLKSAPLLGALNRISRIFFRGTGIEAFYPSIRIRDVVCDRVRSCNVDAILTIWCPEGLASTQGCKGVPRIAYHGDIDFIPGMVRAKDHWLFSDPSDEKPGSVRKQSARFLRRLGLAKFKQAHLRLMRGVDVVANVTASNADFYAKHGHPGSVYIRNVWSDMGVEGSLRFEKNQKENRSNRLIKIVGHVGYLNRTGSTYGLKFLLVDVLPRMEQTMKGLDYQIHIIGGGEVAPALKPWLRDGRVLMRGFVEDLDGELRSSDLYLMLNNAGPYQAAYSRHILAWSMGLCMIVHANSQKAIPEITHEENALVGSTAEEIARMIFRAATDSDLNLRIRRGGRATYEKYFTPSVVAEALSEEIARVVAREETRQSRALGPEKSR